MKMKKKNPNPRNNHKEWQSESVAKTDEQTASFDGNILLLWLKCLFHFQCVCIYSSHIALERRNSKMNERFVYLMLLLLAYLSLLSSFVGYCPFAYLCLRIDS